MIMFFFFFQAEDGIRDYKVTGVQTCALPIYSQQRRRWEWLAIGFAFVMSMSRVYLSAHWFSDVVAGALLGAGLAGFLAAAGPGSRGPSFPGRGGAHPPPGEPGRPRSSGERPGPP